MMRMVDPERHAARRTQILEGAATAFAQKGYDNTTVKHVYTAAGVGSGTLFHYFADKRAIFHGVLEADLAAIDVTDARAGMWAVIDRRPRHPRPGPRHRSTHPQTDPRPHPRLPTTRRQMRKLTRKQALDANNVSGHLPTMSRDITAWSRLVSNQRPSACEAAVNAVDLRRKHFRALNGERLTCFDAYESLLHRT